MNSLSNKYMQRRFLICDCGMNNLINGIRISLQSIVIFSARQQCIKKLLPHLRLPFLINFMTCNQITGCTEAIIKKKVIFLGLFAQQPCSPKIFDQISCLYFVRETICGLVLSFGYRKQISSPKCCIKIRFTFLLST